MKKNQTIPITTLFLCVIFFLSGIPALLYQIVWQRSLFAIYGVNMESVTVVVTAFMLGLGLGSLFGGWVSKHSRVALLGVYAVAELAIALFGFFSLRLFDWVGSYTLSASVLETGFLTFALVLLPTMMMGATLPLLVTYLVRRSPNVGRSTGILYFFNTLGSAVACLVLALYLMKTFGKAGSLTLAATLNLLVGLGALALYLNDKKVQSSLAIPVRRTIEAVTTTAISFPVALAIGFASGFIALSYEILWIRVYQMSLTGLARAFPLVLSAYLAGLALGAIAVYRFCPDEYDTTAPVPVRAFAVFLFFANMLGFLLIPAAARLFQHGHDIFPFILMIPTAGCLGATLPLLSHMAVSPDDKAGYGLSWLYFLNILGAALGSYLTGFLLLDHLPLARIALALAILGFSMTTILLLLAREGRGFVVASVMLMAFLGLVFARSSDALYDRVYERIVLKSGLEDGTQFAHVVENRHGVVNVTHSGTVYGDGLYDGEFNTDLVNDVNLVVRAYALNAFHPSPKKVLVIGLSSGSWVQVLAHNPEVEKLTVVEINPAYLQIIPKYKIVKTLLSNLKIEIVIDDGRRWLFRNSERRFDAVIMNTTWHYKAFATNLLSVEFLNLVRSHLNPGGILFYNTTFSNEADRTGATVFPYAYKFINFMLVSDSPIIVNTERLTRTLKDYTLDGKPVLKLSKPEDRDKLEEILGVFASVDQDRPWMLEMESRDHILARTAGLGIITDDNMLSEWRGKD